MLLWWIAFAAALIYDPAFNCFMCYESHDAIARFGFVLLAILTVLRRLEGQYDGAKPARKNGPAAEKLILGSRSRRGVSARCTANWKRG